MPWLSHEILILRPPESRNFKGDLIPDFEPCQSVDIHRDAPWVQPKNSLSRSISQSCGVCFIVDLAVRVKPCPS